jgi:hypothetical protein
MSSKTRKFDSKNEINWWISNLKSANGKFIRQKSIDCWIETDITTFFCCNIE